MVYKNKDIKKDKILYRKLIFSIVLLVYFLGLCSGCSFALKNADNLGFVQKVTCIQNLLKTEQMPGLNGSVKFLIRDITFVILILIFKYSGVLKGVCVCIPFVMAVQNTCMYTILLYLDETGWFNLIFNYILKDTAVSFMVLMFLYITVVEILQDKINIKKDISKLLIYCVGITCIYIIDIAVKIIIYPYYL